MFNTVICAEPFTLALRTEGFSLEGSKKCVVGASGQYAEIDTGTMTCSSFFVQPPRCFVIKFFLFGLGKERLLNDVKHQRHVHGFQQKQ